MNSRESEKTREELIQEIEELRARLHKNLVLKELVHELEVHQEEVRVQNEQLLSAQHALEISRDRYADLYDFAPTAYLTLDKQGVILDINLTGCELLSRERARIIGYPFTNFVQPDDRAAFRDHLIRSRRSREATRTEIGVHTNGGTVLPIEMTMVPVSSVKNPPQNMRVVLIDLSERKRAENERRELMEREAAARAASEAKDRFLAVVSHELRTPLTPILALVSTLERRHDIPQDVRAMLEVIRRNINIEEKLINDLLDLNRMAHGKLRLMLDDTDAHAIIRHVVEMCGTDIQAKNMRLEVDLLADQHWVRADALRLRQIIWNLLINSIKYTPRGGKLLVRSLNEGKELVIEVTDNGIGIDPEALNRVFSFYEQEGRDPGSEMRGLGIGLPIAKALVEAHEGRISATSPGAGKGTTFRIALSVIAAPEVAKSGPPTPAPKPASTPERQQLSILLVEDHADTALAMVHLLKTAGHEVTVAPSVSAALAQGERGFDLLISDLDLPDGSGLDVMRSMHSNEHLRGIVVSGFGRDEDIRRCYEAGFSVHLTKPLDFDRLIDTIKEIAST